MYKKILVPLDGSPLAEAALPHAEALAKSEGAEIILLRVAVTPARYLFAHNPAEGNNIIHMIEMEAEEYLKEEVAKLQSEGVKVTGITCDGTPPEEILEAAEETHADVIAMATHGHVGIQRLLQGSVAEEVVHASHIPVMLIHPSLN
jgi:nucleotide-binding universal stress UspA family protein